MPRYLLNDKKIQGATVPDGARFARINDGEGLHLLVERIKRGPGCPKADTPTIRKRWRFGYRYHGRQNMLALGDYPTVGLKVARDMADKARALLAEGKDPSALRKAEKRSSANTFDAWADGWLGQRRADAAAGVISFTTLEKLTWIVGLLRPSLGSTSLDKMTAWDCTVAVRAIEAKGMSETAHRARATLGRILAAAANTGVIPRSPMPDSAEGVLGAKTGGHYPAVTDPREGDRDGDAAKRFGQLLRKIETYEGSELTRLALKLLTLTALRPGELRQLRWSWICGLDGESPRIELPPEITKLRRPHVVHLSAPAVDVVKRLRELSAMSVSEFVFPTSQPRRTMGKDGKPSKRPLSRHMSEGALKKALARLGYESDVHVPHGFRSAFSTLAHGAKAFPPDVVEEAIAHASERRKEVAGIYNRGATEFAPQIAQWWADRVDAMREGQVIASNVVRLRRT